MLTYFLPVNDSSLPQLLRLRQTEQGPILGISADTNERCFVQ